VLRESELGKPLHYTRIIKQAISRGFIQPMGRTPAASLLAMVGTDIRRRGASGRPPRFIRPRPGMIGLAATFSTGIVDRIEESNREIRETLLDRVSTGSPGDFEQLIGELLAAMGFEDIEVTPPSRDGGVDARGTLVVGDVVRIRIGCAGQTPATQRGPAHRCTIAWQSRRTRAGALHHDERFHS